REVCGGPDAVAQVVVVDALGDALGDRLEGASRQPAVGGEALGEDEQRTALPGQLVVVEREPTPDVAHRVLLGRHGHAVRTRGHVANDGGDLPALLTLFTLTDEPRVLAEPARVEDERLAMG